MSENVLFITLDSCRYDTFESQYEANTLPNLKSIGPLHKVQSPSHFTYGSHSAFWMGFTPGNAELDRHYLNPKVGKIFRMSHPGMNAGTKDLFVLDGVNIVDGFNNKGYLTIGTGAVEWFNPKTQTGSVLGDYFHQFFYSENTWSLESQLKWIDEVFSEKDDDSNVFCFLK